MLAKPIEHPVCSLAELASIHILKGINEQHLRLLRDHLELCSYAQGETILRQKEATEALYFLLSGRVSVILKDDNNKQHILTELGPGETFGERALLTGEPRTADVIARSPAQALRLQQEDFNAMLRHCPEIYANLCVKLARELGNWAIRHQQDERENRAILNNLVGWQLLPEFEAFPGTTQGIRLLNKRLEKLGKEQQHVLILGERGTWKDLVARLIHFHQEDASRPVLFLDCAKPPPILRDRSTAAPSVEDSLTLQIAQESALFGHEPDSTIYARGTRRGMLELAEGGDLILRNIDNLAVPVQKMLSTFLQTGRYRRRGEQEERYGKVRLLATSSAPLQAEVDKENFEQQLLTYLAGETVKLPPLRERKKDIPVIARHLLRNLNQKHHKRVRRLSQEAQNLLVEHDWPLNGTELYQVLSRAVAVCNGPEISSEHIFVQGQINGAGRINLLNHPSVDKLVRRPSFPGRLRWVTAPLFLALVVLTLWGPEYDNPANLLVWIAWWPLLLTGAAFTARSWCSCCPLEALSSLLPKRRARKTTAPAWLRDWGPPLSMAALTMILLIEQASGMFAWARATGVLLTGLITATLLTEVFFGARSWCKYLCPLGGVISLVSRISLTELYSNATVCQSRCKVDDCIKEKACPMGLHPTGINTTDHCVLCFSCVRNCPHHAIHLDLRNPAAGILQRPRRRFSEALFAVTLTGAVLASKLTPWLTGRPPEVFVSTPWSQKEIAIAMALVVGYAAIAMLSSIGSRGRRWAATFTICGQAYLPLAFAGLFTIYFVALVEGGASFLPLVVASLGIDHWLHPSHLVLELGTLGYLPPLLLAAGTSFSWYLLNKLNGQYALSRLVRIAHQGLILMTFVAFLIVM